MKLFGQLVRTAVNLATLPVAVGRDVLTLGGAIDNNGQSHTVAHVQRLKDEAGER